MSEGAPFPWFGGKSRVAHLVWRWFGADVANYVEPFFGSGAVLLGRPGGALGIETVNDLDGYVANFWRAVRGDPDAVASYADWPANENDLHARHVWLRERGGVLARRLEGDPEYFDAKVAGWWVWGLSVWIGSGFCGPSGGGPWVVEVDDEGARQLVRSGDAGQGVKRQLVHIGNAGQGVKRQKVDLLAWFRELSERLSRVRVCSGDWTRILGPSPTTNLGATAVFLDPPYSAEAGRDNKLYAEESLDVAHAVRAWCLEHGDDRKLRIVLCGDEGERHDGPMLEAGWTSRKWKAMGGYGGQGNGSGKLNAAREVLWISPHCLAGHRQEREMMFEMFAEETR